MVTWADLGSFIVGLIGVVLGTVVSIVLYRLSRALTFRSRMSRWDELRAQTHEILRDHRGTAEAPEATLINVRRYKHYEGGNDVNLWGYQQLRAELLGARHNGIEFISGVRETWYDDAGMRTFKATEERAPNVYVVGFVPFENVEHIRPRGDEYKNAPAFYVHFRGPGRDPYVRYSFRAVDGFEFGQPSGRVYFPIVDELGVLRIGRIAGWRSLLRNIWTNYRIDRAVRAQWRQREQEREREARSSD